METGYCIGLLRRLLESDHLGAAFLFLFILPTTWRVDMVAGAPAAVLDLKVTLKLETCVTEQKERQKELPH